MTSAYILILAMLILVQGRQKAVLVGPFPCALVEVPVDQEILFLELEKVLKQVQ